MVFAVVLGKYQQLVFEIFIQLRSMTYGHERGCVLSQLSLLELSNSLGFFKLPTLSKPSSRLTLFIHSIEANDVCDYLCKNHASWVSEITQVKITLPPSLKPSGGPIFRNCRKLSLNQWTKITTSSANLNLNLIVNSPDTKPNHTKHPYHGLLYHIRMKILCASLTFSSTKTENENRNKNRKRNMKTPSTEPHHQQHRVSVLLTPVEAKSSKKWKSHSELDARFIRRAFSPIQRFSHTSHFPFISNKATARWIIRRMLLRFSFQRHLAHTRI